MDLFHTSQKALRRFLVARGVGSNVIGVGGTAIHYYDVRGEGSGPPVLLVHGLGGSANGFFRIFNGLAKRFSRILAPDLPGHGFSPLPPTGPLPLLGQFELLQAFANEMLREPAYVVGNSLGGAMSIMLTHAAPKHVKGLALIAPAGAKVAAERMAELFSAMAVKNTSQARALTRRLFHSTPLVFTLFAHELKKMYGTEAVLHVFKEVTPDLASLEPEILSSIKVPTLLLWGGSEKLLPFEGVDYFRAHLPKDAEIHVVKRFGHVPQVERPGEVVKHLVRFADARGI